MILGMLFFDNAIVGLANSLQGSIGVSEGTSLWISSIIAAIVASVVCVGLLSLVMRYKGKMIRDNGLNIGFIHVPNLPSVGNFFKALHLPTPSFRFDLSGWKGITAAVGMVAVGFAAAFTLVIATTDDTPTWPQAGAAYALPSTVGTPLEPDIETPEQRSQTLKINLAAGVRLTSLTLNNLDLGKTGLTDCIEITRKQNTSGWLYVDNWTATGASAPSADFANAEIANLNLAAYVDGHTVEATIDSTITDLEINSTRGAGEFTAQNSVVDRVLIVLGGDATIGTLAMTDVDCSVGGWNVDYVKAGSFTLDNTSRFGDGDGINTADFVVNDTVKARNFTDTIVDTPITVR